MDNNICFLVTAYDNNDIKRHTVGAFSERYLAEDWIIQNNREDEHEGWTWQIDQIDYYYIYPPVGNTCGGLFLKERVVIGRLPQGGARKVNNLMHCTDVAVSTYQE